MTTSAIAASAVDRLLRRRDVEANDRHVMFHDLPEDETSASSHAPCRIGTGLSGAVAWRLSDIKDWMESRPVADPKRL